MTPEQHNKIFFAGGVQNKLMLDHCRSQYREACKWNARLLLALLVLVGANTGFAAWWFLTK